jgi:hypothetical protein
MYLYLYIDRQIFKSSTLKSRRHPTHTVLFVCRSSQVSAPLKRPR